MGVSASSAQQPVAYLRASEYAAHKSCLEIDTQCSLTIQNPTQQSSNEEFPISVYVNSVRLV